MNNRIKLEKEKQQIQEEIDELNLQISKKDTEPDEAGKMDWNRNGETQLLVEKMEEKQARLKKINGLLGYKDNL